MLAYGITQVFVNGPTNINLQVIDCKVVVSRTRPDGSSVRIAECTVGDDTGVITLTARNQQGE